MADYVEVDQARRMPGLRIVLTAGFPGPWGEAVKSIFQVKRVPFTPVRQVAAGPNAALVEWTGQASAPVVVWNDERPRSLWTEQLLLAERLAPEPALIPADPESRALMFGYSHEICGEMGFGWCRRLMIVHEMLSSPHADDTTREFGRVLGARYGYDPDTAAAAPRRVVDILGLLHARLERQQAAGSQFFLGDRLSALDIYWAAFAALIEPLPHDLCPMPESMRRSYTTAHPLVRAAATPLLLRHRDRVYRDHLETPLDF